jgi:hypothetical protein
MKLLRCNDCKDIFSLSSREEKTCFCERSKGKYLDSLNAVYSGPCTPLGFDNMSFNHAIMNQKEKGNGTEFKAFIIPKNCSTFIKEDI